MNQEEWAEMCRLVAEIKIRLSGDQRNMPFEQMRQPEHIQMGGIYWRLTELTRLANRNLEHYESQAHTKFLRETHGI